MDQFVLAAQVGLPLVLIGWLAFFPASSVIGVLVQIVGSGLTLLALSFVAIMVMPPLWVFYLVIGIYLLAAASAIVRLSAKDLRLFPCRSYAWGGFISAILLAVVGGTVAFNAYRGLEPGDVAVVNVALPFRSGTFIVANGGFTKAINGHVATLDRSTVRYRKWRGQSYGLDLFRVDQFGLRVHGWRPRDPARYLSYGTPIYAPCSGRVISSRRDLPDMQVPTMDRANMLGNHVLLDCESYWLLLAHFRQNTVRAEVGETVTAGALLGELGNSGNSSEPHLHIHVQRPGSVDAPISGEPLALSIEGRLLVRNDFLTAAQK